MPGSQIGKARFIKQHPDAVIPKFAYEDDVGADITFITYTKITDTVFMLDSGLIVEPPAGYYFELYPRSSIYKTEFAQANGVGIIDPGYRGTLKMPVRYYGAKKPSDAVADMIGIRFGQLILRQINRFEFEEAQTMGDTARGNRGFGSSGHTENF